MNSLSTKQSIALAVFSIVLLATLNVWGNSFKTSECERAGGQFVKNVSDSTLSTCILEK